ncbi:MAG: hypothetical protein AAF763_19015 [Pseudomonadota bacterium]
MPFPRAALTFAALVAALAPRPAAATPGLTAATRLHGSCAAYAAFRESDFPEAVALAAGGPAPQGEDARRNAAAGLRWANRRAFAESRAAQAVASEQVQGREGAPESLEALLAWWSTFVGDIPVAQREAWATVTCPVIYEAADAQCAETACDALPD